MKWFRREAHRNRARHHGSNFELVDWNSPTLHADPLNTRMETCHPFYRHWLTGYNAPFDFKMHRLVNTFTHWLEEMGLENKTPSMTLTRHSDIVLSPEPAAEHVSIPLCVTSTNRALDPDEDHLTSDTTSLCALHQPNLKCDLYNMTGHEKCSCDYLARHALVAEHVKSIHQSNIAISINVSTSFTHAERILQNVKTSYQAGACR